MRIRPRPRRNYFVGLPDDLIRSALLDGAGRALARDPKLFLFDEPLSNLDPVHLRWDPADVHLFDPDTQRRVGP
jgi:hypothetical protein